MDITLLPPSTILSRHSHLSLLSFPLLDPQNSPAYDNYTSGQSRVPFSSYFPPRLRASIYQYKPPRRGTFPLSTLPDDLVLEILSYLDYTTLLPLQAVSRRFKSLCLHPVLHHTLSIHTLPPLPLPQSLADHLLKSVKNLTIHLFPYNHPYSSSTSPIKTTIHALLSAIPKNQLRSLNLPFSSPYLSNPDLAEHLKRIGGKLEKLDLRGSALNGSSWVDWFEEIGKDGPGLHDLNLSFTSITELPTGTEPEPLTLHPFRNLHSLSLSSCSSISTSAVTTFLKHLPPTIETLDLSRMDQIPYSALEELQVITTTGVTALREMRLVGIDHLTRMDVRGLKRCWEGKRIGHLRELELGVEDMEIEQWTGNCTGAGETRGDVVLPISPIPIPLIRNAATYMGLITPPTTPPRDMALKGYRQYKTSDPTPSYQRSLHDDECRAGVGINIIHSAILESEDEAGYRQFIGEVVEGTLSYGVNRRGRESSYYSDWEEVPGMSGGGYVEIDQGGFIST